MMMYNSGNETIYPYIKVRKNFGRQPRFIRDRYRVHCNVISNRAYRKKFYKRRLLHKGCQACKPFAETPMNTNRRIKVDFTVMHTEGGWPKDVNPNEPDSVIRHRKKLEKEENYQFCVPIMFEKMEKYIKFNNAVDAYGELYKTKWKHRDPNRKIPHAKTVLIYEDPSWEQRSVKKIIWAPENVGRMGVCYCPPKFQSSMREASTEAYFWDVEIASRPESQVRSDSHIMDIMYHPKDMYAICGGCFDGTVQNWDARIGPNPQSVTPLTLCHSDVCTGVSWVNSKTNSEFFSTGLDGQVIWWDIRNMSERIETVYLDPEKGQMRPEAALKATVLNYEHTVPTKYIAGLEDGRIMLMMRKGKTPYDKLVNVWKGHRSSIIGVHRNPTFAKNFMTVSGLGVKIYSEDCKDSPIMWIRPKNVLYTHAAWVPSRPSVFVVTRNDGYFEIYDVLKNPARPYRVIKLRASLNNKKKPARKFKRELMQDIHLTYVAACDPPSKLLAIGSSKGNIYMQKMAESLFMSEKIDKPVLAQCFERETRRERIIEQRFREIRLRKRDKLKVADLKEKIKLEREALAERLTAEATAEGKVPDLPEYKTNSKFDLVYEAKHDPICKVEREFFMDLEREILEKGIDAWSEFSEAIKTEKVNKEEEVEVKEVDDALDVTAEDLAAYANMSYDDDDYDDEARRKKQKTEQSKQEQVQGQEAPQVASQPPDVLATQEIPPGVAPTEQSTTSKADERDLPPEESKETEQPPITEAYQTKEPRPPDADETEKILDTEEAVPESTPVETPADEPAASDQSDADGEWSSLEDETDDDVGRSPPVDTSEEESEDEGE